MERAVAVLVTGGWLLVVGLWLATLSATGAASWVIGLVLAVVGLGGLGFGGWKLLYREHRHSEA